VKELKIAYLWGIVSTSARCTQVERALRAFLPVDSETSKSELARSTPLEFLLVQGGRLLNRLMAV
jgi:hypothetical protein